MNGPQVVCVACGKVTNSIASPLCDACMKSSPEHQVDMLFARMVLNQVVIPPAEQEVPNA
ncbi:hypothetical protein GCM10009552_15460 [Rothia nasimurium]|uniref:Uncharacterized protein n=1 Tax=Luteibacter anthropi TaxID=564369 RepID=A0A7X5UB02_9GAMM|nr:hypothetical protein [Luteibacter anthropi]NII07211.1 hypothetical protein [Luteibacter anthropi]